MNQVLKVSLAIGLGLALVFGGSYYGITSWIDRQEIPTAKNSRAVVRFVGTAYKYLPTTNKEKYVVRIFKLAHMAAISELGKKSVVELADDMAFGYRLLAGAVTEELHDETARSELTIERLLYFNRMQALAMSMNRSLVTDGSLSTVARSINQLSDDETRRVAIRETQIGRILDRSDDPAASQQVTSFEKMDRYSAVDGMEIGLAYCGAGKAGEGYLKEVVPYFSSRKVELVYSVSRNIDAPLFALASGPQASPACVEVVESLTNLMGGKNG